MAVSCCPASSLHWASYSRNWIDRANCGSTEVTVGEYSQTRSGYRDQACPECGERIPRDALDCPVCDARLVDDGYDADRLPEIRRRRPRYQPHNGQTVMILGIVSFFFVPH